MAGPSQRPRLSDSTFLRDIGNVLPKSGLVSGREGDFVYAVLDARRFDMTVVECPGGLTDAVAAMPSPPAVVMNGQFIQSQGFGWAPEGQVVREYRKIHDDSRSRRWYLAQSGSGRDARGFLIGEGDPWTRRRNARAAFGGLGPVLARGRPAVRATPWIRAIYNKPANVGKGVIGIDRKRNLVVLLIQEDRTTSWTPSQNTTTLEEIQNWLQSWDVVDAVFNDGSDSESLFVRDQWLVRPGWVKNEAMDFAIGFVDRKATRRVNVLALDGTDTRDAAAFMTGILRPAAAHYAPRNVAKNAARNWSALRSAVSDESLDVWRAPSSAGRHAAERLVELGGVRNAWADVLYISSHATRHGKLYYHRSGGHRGRTFVFADPWSKQFKPVWRNSPTWLILVGCAALGLRYTRFSHLLHARQSQLRQLNQRHRDIHGRRSKIVGLTGDVEIAFIVHHPGWRWYDHVFRRSGLRGVLGYWNRSPGGEAGDVEIVSDFAKLVGEGWSLLGAWREANQRGWTGAAAAWAAMVRSGCETDTLATLERRGALRVDAPFRYFDDHQSDQGEPMPRAYRLVNQPNDSIRFGRFEIPYHDVYDEFAIDGDRKTLGVEPSRKNTLLYDDGVGP